MISFYTVAILARAISHTNFVLEDLKCARLSARRRRKKSERFLRVVPRLRESTASARARGASMCTVTHRRAHRDIVTFFLHRDISCDSSKRGRKDIIVGDPANCREKEKEH